MKLRQRLRRLESKRGGPDTGPEIIYLCDGNTGEPNSAIFKGGGGLDRKADESVNSFRERVTARYQPQ
jgi:hypothetical protein